MNVGDVDFHHGDGQRTDGVEQSHGRVGIGAGVEGHAGCPVGAGRLQAVDEAALGVALIIVYLHVRIAAAQSGQAAVHGARSVDAGLTRAEQVQVRPVQYQNLLFFHTCCGKRLNFAVPPPARPANGGDNLQRYEKRAW